MKHLDVMYERIGAGRLAIYKVDGRLITSLGAMVRTGTIRDAIETVLERAKLDPRSVSATNTSAGNDFGKNETYIRESSVEESPEMGAAA